jgi:hypothetical protein
MTNGTSASLPKYNSFYRTWEPRIGCDASTQSRRQIGCRGLLAGAGLSGTAATSDSTSLTLGGTTSVSVRFGSVARHVR